MAKKRIDNVTAEAIEQGAANLNGEVANVSDESYKLACINVMNTINKLPLMANIWALFQKEHKDEYLGTLLSITEKPTVPQMTTLLYEIRDKYGLKASEQPTAKSERRKARRNRNKMSEDTNEAKAPKERTVRGGENTLVLKNEEGQVIRYKVRAKGAPKYKETGVMRPVIFNDAEGTHEVNFVLNPNGGAFKEGAKHSNRVGFEWNEKWYILDNEDNFQVVLGFPENPGKKDRQVFEILEAGSKLPVQETEAPETETEEEAPLTTEETDETEEVFD